MTNRENQASSKNNALQLGLELELRLEQTHSMRIADHDMSPMLTSQAEAPASGEDKTQDRDQLDENAPIQTMQPATPDFPELPEYLINRAARTAPPLAPLPCGVVIFDHPDQPMAGTAYLGHVAPQRIRSTNDLRNDALWVSNATETEDRASSHPNLRAGPYFSLSLTEIAHDLGIECSREGQMQCDDALKISEFMTRAMTIAARAYGWDMAESGPLHVQEPTLMQDIEKMLPQAPSAPSSIRDHLVRALTQAHQADSVPDWAQTSFEPESIFVTLRFNRLNYAQALLDCPVPKGQSWAYEKDVLSNEKTLRYCMEHPCLVKASVEFENVSSELAALISFGQAGARRNTMRQWISQPELVWLSQYARITITSLWVDRSGYAKISPAAKLPPLFSAHPEACLSYSAGLIAANHWEALSACQWSRRLKTEESNLWATWLRAYDRANMFALALKALEAGFHVERYGAGSMKLRAARTQLEALARFKAEHGFMYPDLISLAH